MRPDRLNTLTRQSASTNDGPRDPFHDPVTWNPDRSTDIIRLRICLCPRLYCRHDHCKNYADSSRSCPFLRQVSDASAIIGIVSSTMEAVSYWIRLIIFDLIILNGFLIWLESIFYLIWFRSHTYNPILVKLQGLPNWIRCLRSYPTLKLWNIQQFW